MGEIRTSKKGYEVYDAQNQLQSTIKQKPIPPSKKKSSLLGIILFVAGLPVAIFALLGLITGVEGLFIGFFEGIILTVFGVVLTVFGIICLVAVGYQRPEWRVEDPNGQQLAEIKETGKFFAEYQILAPDGGVIARIHKKRGLAAFRYSYSIDIIRQVLDPLFIVSFTILRADMDKAVASTAPRGFMSF